MPNHLANSKSLYLRKHADNPINWWPWCEEALQTAASENKPIFLSIGYSSCHWCTVMEGEAFSNQEIADYMNANFLPIKVDREERPDIDSIYMQALQMIAGQGGWPLNIFLTPDDLIPFYGGTYFPVEPRYGRAGFLEILQALRRFYDTDKAKLNSIKSEILENLQNSANLPTSSLTQNLLHKGLDTATTIIATPVYGPAFPMIPYAEAALRASRFENEEFKHDPKNAALQRGLDLVLGGIYDHVSGGFHRYTVDPNWTVPHFEKMLYDNGQIVEYLSELWASGIKESAIERAIAGTVEWLKREMTSTTGYFYAAQDADSFPNSDAKEPEEGHFYVWSYSELQQNLSRDELAELEAVFSISKQGNFEGKNVLQRQETGKLSDSIETTLEKLFKLRYGSRPADTPTFPSAPNNQEAKTANWPGRIPPVTDTKMIVAWNSLMISGLARASAVFGKLEYLQLAIKAAEFILKNQFIENRFHRLNYDGETSILAQSEDYAFFIKALLDIHQACLIYPSFQPNYWLEEALKLQTEFDKFLGSSESGGYYNTASDASQDLLVRERSYIDNATFSANGIAIANLVRLSELSENQEYMAKAEKTLQAFSSAMLQASQGCPSLFTGLDWYQNQTLIRTNSEHIAQVIKEYAPAAIYKLETDLPGGSVGLVCQGLRCLEPATTIEQMLQQIQESQILRKN